MADPVKTLRASTRLVLSAIPLTGLLLGVLSQFIRPGQVHGYLLFALCGFMQTFLIFLWYRLDAQKRGFHRSRLMNTGIAGIATLALPYYLFRSRGFLGGLAATALAVLLFLVTLLMMVVGAAGGYLVRHSAVEAAAVNVTTTPTSQSKALPGEVELNRQIELLLSNNIRYPLDAQHHGREGTALVKVYVLRSGQISRAELVRSSGDADLDAEAVAVWARLKAEGKKLQVPDEFKPGRGELTLQLPVAFSLAE
ncbi:MAG: hypothetical protein JWR07_4773 [Nevskia sp.]|nr:hypothetical protein [Nevskia sp.]